MRANWDTYYMNRFIAVGRTWAATWKVLRCAFPESTVPIIAYWSPVATSIIKIPLRAKFVSSLGRFCLDSIGRCRQQVITSITIMPHGSSFSFANGSDSSERESLTVWHLSRFSDQRVHRARLSDRCVSFSFFFVLVHTVNIHTLSIYSHDAYIKSSNTKSITDSINAFVFFVIRGAFWSVIFLKIQSKLQNIKCTRCAGYV